MSLMKLALILIFVFSLFEKTDARSGESWAMDRGDLHGRLSSLDQLTNLSERKDDREKQAGDAENMTRIGAWAEGPCLVTALGNGIACFGNGGYLELLDTSGTGDPVRIPQKILLPGLASGIAIENSCAFVAILNFGLYIIDISNPYAPRTLSSLRTEGAAKDVAVIDGIAYLADGVCGLRIIDVTTPIAPLEIGYMPFSAMAVDVANDSCLALLANVGLYTIDISNPTLPLVIDSIGIGTYGGQACSVGNGYAFVAVWATKSLSVINISNPANLINEGFYSIGATPYGVEAAPGYIYVAHGDLLVLDAANPGSLVEETTYVTDGWTVAASYRNGIVGIGNSSSGFGYIDVSSPNSPINLGSYPTGGRADDVIVHDGFAYMIDHWNGMRVVNIEEPDAPEARGLFGTGGGGRSLSYYNGHVFLAETYEGLFIIDSTIPESPVEVSHYMTPGVTNFSIDLAVENSIAYLEHGPSAGLDIIDISVPNNPRQINRYQDDILGGMAVQDGILYFADSYYGLIILDVRDPMNPLRRGELPAVAGVQDLVVSGDFAYLVDGNSWLYVVNIKSLDAPYVADSAWTFSSQSVEYADGYAYVADGVNGLLVFDVTNPSAIYQVGYFDTGGEASGVAVNREHVFVADGDNGLQVIRNNLPMSNAEHFPTVKNASLTSYPNPFNPHTTIAFELPWRQAISLDIFDVAGRLVKVLVDGKVYEEGRHEAFWDGRDETGRNESSGVYFCRIVSGAYSETKRMVLVK